MNPRELQKLQQQMMRAQEQMAKAQEQAAKELSEMRIEGTAGGGAVAITLSGDQQAVSVRIDPDAIDPEDVASLEDMVLAALKSALEQAAQAQQAAQDRVVSSATGGLKLPPGFGF